MVVVVIANRREAGHGAGPSWAQGGLRSHGSHDRCDMAVKQAFVQGLRTKMLDILCRWACQQERACETHKKGHRGQSQALRRNTSTAAYGLRWDRLLPAALDFEQKMYHSFKFTTALVHHLSWLQLLQISYSWTALP